MLSFETRGNFVDFKYTEDVYPYYVHLVMTLHNTSKCITWGYGEAVGAINFTIDDTTYDEIPITSIQFDGVSMSEQSDFKTNIESMFPGLAGGTIGGSSYLVYGGVKMSQSGTSNPTVVANENTLSVGSWERLSAGKYFATCQNTSFDLSKIWVGGLFINDSGGTGYVIISNGSYDDPNGAFKFIFSDEGGGIMGITIWMQDGVGGFEDLSNFNFPNLMLPEIRVYS